MCFWMLAYVACCSVKFTNGLFCWTVVSQSSSAWNLVVVSSLLSKIMNISGGLSWMEWPQKPRRLNLFAPFSSFADWVVVVRAPGWLFPIMFPLVCCMFATIARTAPKISCSQLGSMIGSMVLVGWWLACWFMGGAIVGSVYIPMV